MAQTKEAPKAAPAADSKVESVTPPTEAELMAEQQASRIADLEAELAAAKAKLELVDAPRPADQMALPVDAAAKSVVGIARKWETHDAVRVDH